VPSSTPEFAREYKILLVCLLACLLAWLLACLLACNLACLLAWLLVRTAIQRTCSLSVFFVQRLKQQLQQVRTLEEPTQTQFDQLTELLDQFYQV
jgi:hypothetical protein